MYNYMPQNNYMPVEPIKQMPNYSPQNMQLKNHVLNIVMPFVNYGLIENKYTSLKHALTEVSAIAYLIGKGYQPQVAHKIVESWEFNEKF